MRTRVHLSREKIIWPDDAKSKKLKPYDRRRDLRDSSNRFVSGDVNSREASAKIRAAIATAAVEDLGFARVDTHRELRQGFPEVILGLGKTPAQIAAIAERIFARGQALLVTRAMPEAFEAVRAVVPTAVYHSERPGHHAGARRGAGWHWERCVIACAGTSDLPVAEEAAVTAEIMGNTVERLYDVGVAGLHRMLNERAAARIRPGRSSSSPEWRARCPASSPDW